MSLVKKEEIPRARLDTADARDRWEWVSQARSRAARALEQGRAGKEPGFLLSLPHQDPGG